MNISDTDNGLDIPITPPKAKRGRKPKNANLTPVENPVVTEPHIPKKRGRKPKGGKIIAQNVLTMPDKIVKPSIILHLKCSIRDLDSQSHQSELLTDNNIFNYTIPTTNELNYEVIEKPTVQVQSTTTNIDELQEHKDDDKTEDNKENTRIIWKKLKQLEQCMHANTASQPKSACFWCSCDFDNPPIYIPKHFIKEFYHVYGCFCTPECATAYLMRENIDSSVKFERYSLINNLYCKIFEHTDNIKPAPDPHYFLDKYYGNMTIKEYRKLLKSDRLFLVIDKPISKILPEIHEDNEDFIINNKIIPSNNYQVKKRLQKSQTKNNIVNEHFGMNK